MMKRSLLSFLALALIPLCGPAADATALRVMSFNVRYGSAKDGENHWEKRKGLLLDTIRDIDPDLLGTQETEDAQGAEIAAAFPGFARFGVGRDDGKRKGESATLFYRTSRFERIDAGHFWLSPRPDVPGSKGWDAAYPRVTTWVALRDRAAGGRPFVWVNTHLDNAGVTARLEGARMIHRWLAAHTNLGPAIISADYNCTEDSAPYRALRGAADDAPMLLDAYREAHPQREGDEATYHGFAGKQAGSRIDWILHAEAWRAAESSIIRTNRDGRFPSDHFPVTAVLLWREPESAGAAP